MGKHKIKICVICGWVIGLANCIMRYGEYKGFDDFKNHTNFCANCGAPLAEREVDV